MPRQIGLLTIVTVVHVGLLFVQHDQAGTAIYCARNKKNKKAKREHQANLQLYREPSIIAASHYRNACASSTKHARTRKKPNRANRPCPSLCIRRALKMHALSSPPFLDVACSFSSYFIARSLATFSGASGRGKAFSRRGRFSGRAGHDK